MSAMNFKEFIESLGKALGMRLENAGGACGLDVDGVTVMIHDADDLVLLALQGDGRRDARNKPGGRLHLA